MDKKSLSERDICTKFITPALRKAGWDEMAQIREEVSFTKGRIIVRGKLVSRGKGKRADYILYYKPNIPIALIEAKDNTHATGDGMQQGLDYAETLRIPFVFSSNGDGFVFHDRTGAATERETTLGLDAFPPPGELWERYRAWKGLTPESESIVLQDYFDDDGGKAPRYPFAQHQFKSPQRGIKNSFRLTDVAQFLVPLPPLAEQHRIVAKVDELMALCDQLEATLATDDDNRRRLLDALLHEVVVVGADRKSVA